MNRTLVETVRSMLFYANLPHKFWGEALSTAAYLRNRSPTKAVKGMTPYEAWTGDKPKVDHLRIFGGELHYFFGVNVKQNLETGKIWISQSFYAQTVLKKFGLENCKPAATPVATGTKLL